MPQNNSNPAPSQHSGDELEAKLAADLHHTLKLVPSSQRELFVYELAKYREAEKQAYAAEADRTTLETVAALLNGDDNQLEVIRTYVLNKLRAKAKLTTPNKD